MDAVAIGADGGLSGSVGDGAAVHTSARRNRTPWVLWPTRSIAKILPVTGAASRGNVVVMDGRLGIIGRKNLVRCSVTGEASGRFLFTVFTGGSVHALLEAMRSIGMASGALLGNDLSVCCTSCVVP